MKFNAVKAALIASSVVGATVLGYGQEAWAGSLHNGWNYAIDSFNDGTQGRTIGQNSAFEFYGMAMKQTRDKVFFAINSNLSQDGKAYGSARNGSVSYGDLFLNFANTSSVSDANGNLHAIRFNDANDSKDFGIEKGLYSNVTGVGLMADNLGYSNLESYRNAVNNRYGGNASFGDLDAQTAYFNHDGGATLNASAYGYTNIESGTLLGGIEAISNLADLGLDFGHFGATGSETFGFSVDRNLLPDGEFIAHFFAECDNDGIALAGNLADVPEPTSILSLALLGLAGAGVRRMKQKQA